MDTGEGGAVLMAPLSQAVAPAESGVGRPGRSLVDPLSLPEECPVTTRLNADATADDRVERLLAELTLDEKASLTGGDDVWHLPAVERLGIGRFKMSDGPSGVRGESMGTRRSLSFPCGMAIGATWDADLVGEFGAAVAGEAASKGVHLVLGPTVCIPRTPLAGRTFESYSEDPLLTSRLAVAAVRGVQAEGVGCCIKHFACNDQEIERMTISAEVDDRTLREVHLRPFEAAVREAGVWSVMSAYNKVNGTYSGEHPRLLGEILKDEWGFDGVVVSDWFGTHSTIDAAVAGLDVEMPGMPAFFGSELASAVRAGELDEDVLDEHARRILRLMARTGLLDGVGRADELEDNDPGRRALAHRMVIAGTVLLRNEGVLPLGAGDLSRVAVIGPNADLIETGGGGSSAVVPYRVASFVDELRSRLPGVDIVHEAGCRIDDGLPPIDPRLVGGGLTLEYFANPSFAGEPAGTDTLGQARFVSLGDPAPGVDIASCSVRARATFRPDVSGPWQLGVANLGRTRVLLDGEVVVENVEPTDDSFFVGLGNGTVAAPVELDARREYDLVVELVADAGIPLAGFRLGAARPAVPDAMERAVAAATAAEVAIVVVGSNAETETEGEDRPDLHLIGDQDELLRRVLAVNPRTIVVVNSGAPIEMPWADDAAAVAMLWYPGEEGATALADMVVGAAEPSGRLPITFPARIEDTAAYGRYPGSDGKVVYGEGVFVGYRHLDANDIKPAFCFGHGLSYTSFGYGEPAVEVGPGWTTVTVAVTNTGARRGREVVQLYVGDVDASVPRPERQLEGFAKVELDPGETTEVRFELDDRSFAFWDEQHAAWVVEPGAFDLYVGASSRDLRQHVRIER